MAATSKSPSPAGSWPPPPHDPRERAAVASIDGWEIRIFPEGDRRAEYFTPRGFLHAQLWHPQARVSVLTPSRLTGGLFELYPYQGWKAPVCEPSLLRALVVETHGLPFPCPKRLAAIIEWYVRAAERHADQASEPAIPTAPQLAPPTPKRSERKKPCPPEFKQLPPTSVVRP
jgi:hypothetical protein